MPVRLGMLAAVALVALSVCGAAPATPERDALVRLGRGIGPVERGMTLPQVRRALGGPHVSVYYRFDFGPRGRYLELGWELPGRTQWEPVEWRVGFRSTSRRGMLRVTRVTTTARSQRTPHGIGIGSRLRAVARAYPGATCVTRFYHLPHPHTWVAVRSARGGMTAFQVRELRPASAAPTPYYVTGVMVQRSWFSRGRGHEECRRGWQDW